MNNSRIDLLKCEDDDDELLAEFRSVASRLASQMAGYRSEIGDRYAEIDRITTEREYARDAACAFGHAAIEAIRVTRTRETIDGVECERIKGLDVIVPVGLIPDGEEPKEVRSCRLPYLSRWISNTVQGPVLTTLDGCDYALRMLLVDKSATLPVSTWTPPVSLPDGEYRWDRSVLSRRDAGGGTWKDFAPSLSYSDWFVPASNGIWKVASGKATYLGPHEEKST